MDTQSSQSLQQKNKSSAPGHSSPQLVGAFLITPIKLLSPSKLLSFISEDISIKKKKNQHPLKLEKDKRKYLNTLYSTYLSPAS